MAEIGKLAIEIPKTIEEAKTNKVDTGNLKSHFDHEIDFDLPEMDAITDDGTAQMDIEDRINKELGSVGISDGGNGSEISEMVEYDTFIKSIPSQMNIIYRLIYESMTAGYLNVDEIDTEEKLDREVDYYIEEFQNLDFSSDYNILLILRSELRKNFIPFLRQFIVINLNSVDEIKAKSIEKERMKKKTKPFDEKTYQDLMNIHDKYKSKNKESDTRK